LPILDLGSRRQSAGGSGSVARGLGQEAVEAPEMGSTACMLGTELVEAPHRAAAAVPTMGCAKLAFHQGKDDAYAFCSVWSILHVLLLFARDSGARWH